MTKDNLISLNIGYIESIFRTAVNFNEALVNKGSVEELRKELHTNAKEVLDFDSKTYTESEVFKLILSAFNAGKSRGYESSSIEPNKFESLDFIEFGIKALGEKRFNELWKEQLTKELKQI